MYNIGNVIIPLLGRNVEKVIMLIEAFREVRLLCNISKVRLLHKFVAMYIYEQLPFMLSCRLHPFTVISRSCH